ncbi:hypothetical protein KY285_008041 [Solanum tuberosum]|nr:hypothetical protein KY285_008041 [Solanum tuberosum]
MGMFRGATGDDANHYLMNFVAICKSHEIPEMPDYSIRSWNDLKEAFLERFYPESEELQMKDEISAHKQLPGEEMHDIWWRFSQKQKKCPNHGLTKRRWKQAFYRSLNYVTKPLMDEVAKNNREWHTREVKLEDLGVTFGLSTEQR